MVFFTGSGISAESGVKTFRDNGGLWENHNVYEVATPEAFAVNPSLVLDFYNARRRQMYEVEPNGAHESIAKLQSHYDVHVVTQNVDNLHERAGSKKVLHLHGELDKGRSSTNPNLIVDLYGQDIVLGELAPDGSQLRPHVVWFGEAVPAIEEAIPIISEADIMIIVGTSLQVYPAAGLINYAPSNCRVYCIDPAAEMPMGLPFFVEVIKERAVKGMEILVNRLGGG